MGHCRAAVIAALISVLLSPLAWAQDVTLTSRDGSLKIDGRLLGYDGEFYRVDTIYGALTVDGSGTICEGPGCPDLAAFVARLHFSGEPGMGAVLLPALIESFAAQSGYDAVRSVNDDTTFSYLLREAGTTRDVAVLEFHLSTADEGFADLLAEEADFAMSQREARADEIALGMDAGLGNLAAAAQARVLALDALVPVVSARNTVRTISPEALADVFAGKTTNWQDLSGLDAPIMLHLPDAALGVAQVFVERVLGDGGMLTANLRRHAANDDLVAAVAADPFALGISTMSGALNSQTLKIADKCGYVSAANPETTRTEDYPLTAPLFLYMPSRHLPKIGREFLRYVRSTAAQIVVRRSGFVDQSLTEIPLSEQGDRLSNAIRAAGPEIQLPELQRLVEALGPANRLSLSFRFADGVSALDAQSRANTLLLARAIETGLFDGRKLTFAGFSDGAGAADTNQRLSLQRAISVRKAVSKEAATADLSRIAMDVSGFGEALPMACDDTEWGRRINRRVEVWVR